MSFTTCLIVMLGGALGTLARHAVSVAAAPMGHCQPSSICLLALCFMR